MATRIKTVQYHFPVLASLTNNLLTNVPTLSDIVIEEASGTSFTVLSAWIEVNFRDIITATGGSLTTKTFGFRLGADAYQSITNSVNYGHSAGNNSFKFIVDYTSYVQSKAPTLTNTSADFQLLITQSTGTTLGMVDVCASLFVTYSYDDTDALITKATNTLTMPLEAFRTVLPTTIPATPQNTVPIINGGYLPEHGVSIKQITLLVEANADASNTTDYQLSINIDSGSTFTSGNIEMAIRTDRYFYLHWVNPTELMNVFSAHNIFYWISTGAVTRFNHFSTRLIVTYTYDINTTTDTILSLEIFDFYQNNVKQNVPTVNETNIKLPQFSAVKRCGLYLYTLTPHNATNGIYTKILNAVSYSPLLNQQGVGGVSGSKVFSEYIDSPSLTPNAENSLKFYVYDTSLNGPLTLRYYCFYARWILNLVVNKSLCYDNYKVLIVGLQTTNNPAFPLTLNQLASLPNDYYINHLSLVIWVGGAGVFRDFSCYWYLDNTTELKPLLNVMSSTDERMSGVRLLCKKFEPNEVWKVYPEYWDNTKLDPKSSYNLYVHEQSENQPFSHYFFNVVFSGPSLKKTISGYLYDNSGTYINGTVYLFKKNGNKIELLSSQTVASGVPYAFSVYDNDATYFVVGRKEGTPNIFDVTDFTLQGT